MKKVNLKIPVSMANEFADFLLVNEISVVLSWSEDGDFFGSAQLRVILSFADSFEETFKTSKWFKFFIS